jgi:hypothetical protein
MSLAIPLAKGRSRGRSGRTAAGGLTGGGGVPYLPDPPVWGAIAQLGERLHGMQEVRGSIPRSSTSKINKLCLGQTLRIPIGVPLGVPAAPFAGVWGREIVIQYRPVQAARKQSTGARYATGRCALILLAQIDEESRRE